LLAPLVLGLAAQRLVPQVAQALKRPLVGIANLVLLAALGLLLVAVFPAIMAEASPATVVAMVVFVAASLAVGHLMGGPDRDHAVVLAIACATRNPGIAIAIATAILPAQNFAGMIILYALLAGIASKPYVAWQKRSRALTPQA
jgi:bile acid:Na+ symporter, BASS family